jgi:hypothetical protein
MTNVGLVDPSVFFLRTGPLEIAESVLFHKLKEMEHRIRHF